MSSRARSAVAILLLAIFAAAATADSPQFRGPERDGVFASRNLMKSWPDGGPKLLQPVDRLPDGYYGKGIP